jgi:hypothetical protein
MAWFKKYLEVKPITNTELTKNYCAIHEHASPPKFDGCEKGDKNCLPIMANYAEAKSIASTPYRLSHKRLKERNLTNA